MRADRDDREAGVRPIAATLAAAVADRRRPARPAGRTGRAGRPSRSISSSSHSPRAHVEQPGRGGVRALGDGRAGQPVARAGRGPAAAASARRPASALGGQLVERVERQELQAVAAVELVGARPCACTRSTPAAGALVAVVERLAEQPAAAQQAVVDRPGVDRRCSPGPARPRGRRAQPVERRARYSAEDVPVQPVGRARPGRCGNRRDRRSSVAARPGRRRPSDRPRPLVRRGRPARRPDASRGRRTASSQEGGGDAGVDRDVQAGGVGQVRAGRARTPRWRRARAAPRA